jgi:hypothetical protein
MLFTWLLDKIGYTPKITVDAQISAWPFPADDKDFFGIERKAPVKKKAVAKKPAAKKAAKPKKKA